MHVNPNAHLMVAQGSVGGTHSGFVRALIKIASPVQEGVGAREGQSRFSHVQVVGLKKGDSRRVLAHQTTGAGGSVGSTFGLQ